MMYSGKKLPTLDRVKQRAKKIKKEKGVTHSQALDIISQQFGFINWNDFQNHKTEEEQAEHPTPLPSLNFVEDEDITMSIEDFVLLDNERDEDLELDIKKRINENKKILTKWGVEFSIFEPTETGLKKSILDATQTMRTLFELEKFHYYCNQGQGPDCKVMKEATFLSDEKLSLTQMSLYRPNTKSGDPRMWFRNLKSYASSGDQVAIIIKDDTAYLINLTKIDLVSSINFYNSKIKSFIEKYKDARSIIANELLDKLKVLAKKPFPALKKGDTGIGYTLEEMLGIQANSSKKPDYKGIEIKSGRGGKNRSTLFAQVADWNISPCRRSAEILDKYGYERNGDFKLYCTLNTQKENSQGLQFVYEQNKDQLEEWYKLKDLVAAWPGSLLRKRLKEKHSETFWIEAKSEFINDIEHFQLISVTHTKSPIFSQLMPLIDLGVITMDHLIKRNGKTGKVSEKGPLFKINKRDLDLLFPEPSVYEL